MTEYTPEQEIEELRNKVHRWREVVDGLKNYRPFQLMVEDYQNTIDYVDGAWHTLNIEDVGKFYSLRSQKLAALKIINIIADYEADIDQARARLEELEHPETVQGGYYDNE